MNWRRDIDVNVLNSLYPELQDWDNDPENPNRKKGGFFKKLLTEFCLGWLAYRDACLDANTETADAWGHFMLHHNFLFNSVISDPSDCVSTEEMEEIICVKNAIDAFEIEYGLVLTKEEKMAIKEGASCGTGFDDMAIEVLAKYFSNFNADNIPSGHKIKLVDCSSFQWTQVGQGWVSCLNPTNMEVEIGTSGINFNIELGCISYTVPKTRIDDDGNIVQTISYDEASSCAALASNLATVAVKLSMKMFPLNQLETPGVKTILRKLYKQAYKEAIDKTSCGELGAWGESIATCAANNCPGGSNPGVYTDNVVEVTAESLIGGYF